MNEKCNLVFNFGTAREAYEAAASGHECSTQCPSCGDRVLYSEGFGILLAEAGDVTLAELAMSMHEQKRDQFETQILCQIYQELGRRRTLELTGGEVSEQVRDMSTRIVQQSDTLS